LDEAYLDFPFGLILCGHDRGLRFAARSFLSLLGLSLEEAAGFGWMQRLTPSSVRAVERWRNRKSDRSNWEQELQIKDCRGSLRTLLLHAQNIEGEDKESDTWVIVYLDITERSNSLRSDRYALDFGEAVIATLPNPVAVLHSTHRIVAANPAFYRLFNRSRSRIDGELIHQLTTFQSTDVATLLDDVLRRGKPFDNVPLAADGRASNSAPLFVSGRRLVVPDQSEAMILLTFHQHRAPGYVSRLDDDALVGQADDGDTPSSYRILVVDNSESDAFLLLQLLSVMGHTVATALDGRAGLKQVESFSPDIILADIAMPGMDGIDFARNVRSRDGARRIVLAALTEFERDTDGDGLAEADFDLHLTKPVEITKLQALFDWVEPVLGRELHKTD
jgi:PAS domain S-box-containing protein